MSDEIKNNENICSVTHIRRVDITEKSESTGNGDDRYTDTEEKTAIDIVEQNGQLYVVLTESYYSHSYDQYESPMNTYSESTSFKICAINDDMKDSDKAALLDYMDNTERIRGSYDYAGYPETAFVAAQVERVLKKRADDLRIAEKKAKGECKPNAVYITALGKVSGVYIDSFRTNEDLARMLGCDGVTICYNKDIPDVAYYYNAKVRSGVVYNRLASSFFGTNLEGDIVTCARDKAGILIPLTEHEVEHVIKLFNLKKKLLNL